MLVVVIAMLVPPSRTGVSLLPLQLTSKVTMPIGSKNANLFIILIFCSPSIRTIFQFHLEFKVYVCDPAYMLRKLFFGRNISECDIIFKDAISGYIMEVALLCNLVSTGDKLAFRQKWASLQVGTLMTAGAWPVRFPPLVKG